MGQSWKETLGLLLIWWPLYLFVNTPLVHVAGDSDEAEYAWLPVDCMKPFRPGDETGNPDGSISTDVTLQECVGAADRAVAEIERRLAAADADMLGDGDHTDSDGGKLLHSDAERCRILNFASPGFYVPALRECRSIAAPSALALATNTPF